MDTYFIVLSHFVTAAAALALAAAAFHAVYAAGCVHERAARAIALAAGVLAFTAAKAAGLSLPELLLDAIDGGRWLSAFWLAAFFPGLTGVLVGRYVMSRLRRGDVIALRVMLLVSTFVLLLFGDVYVAAAKQAGYADLKPLLPNVVFALTLMLDVIFEYRPKETSVGAAAAGSAAEA